VVQIPHVYTIHDDLIFLGTDQAQAVYSGVGPTFEGRNRPKDLDHLGAVLAEDDGAGAAGFKCKFDVG